MVRWLCLITLVLLTLSVLACKRDAKSQLVGKWEATVIHKRSGSEVKLLWEFLPDGTFTAAPLNDPITLVDKDTYQIINEGKSVKINSKLISSQDADNVTCTIDGSSMTADNPEYLIKFKKL